MKSCEDLIIFARESLGLLNSVSMELFPLKGRGSDRDFFRLRWNRQASAILMRYDPNRAENAYYAQIAGFLKEIDVPTPRLIRHDPAACLILMEDLGDADLWSFRNASWDNRGPLYEKTLTILHRLHSFPEKDFPAGRVKLMEGFGPALYRWEREYFREHFVRGVCRVDLEPAFDRKLEAELSALSERLSGTGRCLVHRDLQSQNVMIRGNEPFLIDFQGMRFGSPFYDLGSLLCDPYVSFTDRERDQLLTFHYGLGQGIFDQVRFRDYFWEASAQRLMQALGAYGFLGLKKGLKVFLDHIPAGIDSLHRAAAQVGSLPCLRELSLVCRGFLHGPPPF
jgi:aminoglycoside/choline kinase family phosphotransferase